MKKALALILTAAMLFSCLAVGASAARVVTEIEAQYDKTWLGSGDNWNVGFDSMAGDSFTYELKVYSDPDSNNGGLSELNPTMGYGPQISMKTGKVGYGDYWATGGDYYTIDYTFAANTWYDVKYVVDGGNTQIYINGDYVGEINNDAKPMKAVVAFTNYGTYVGDVKITEGDNVIYHNACDEVPADATGGSIEKVEIVAASAKNENVAVSKDNTWLGSGDNWNVGFDSMAGDSFTYELKVYSDPDSNNGGLSELNPTMGYGPQISMKTGKVGYGDYWATGGDYYTIDYTFAASTWYNVKYVVDGGNTQIYINGDYVGEINNDSKPMKAVVAFTNYGTYVSDVKITEGDNVLYHNSCDEVPADATGGSIESFEVEGARYDLGLYYYGMDASVGHYFDPSYNVKGDDDVSFDFMFDSLTATEGDVGAGNRTDVFITGPKLSLADDVIGVNGATVSYDFKADVWYHAEFVADGANTAIYVDGAYVGTVAAVMGDLCFNGHGLAVDNIAFGNHFEDFEDQNFNEAGDSHADVYKYTFEQAEVVDPFETLGMDVLPEGDAWLLEDRNDGYGCGYAKDYPSDVVVNGAVAYSFDIALLAGDHRGDPASDKDPDGSKTYFEIWRDVASKRFEVGFDMENTQLTGFAGEGDAVVGFDWGEMTADNFHNVVMVFRNRVGSIYVDGVKLYEGPSGQAGISGSNTTLFAIWGGSAIIDNMAIYNVEELDNIYAMSEGVLFSGKIENNGCWEGVKGWTVGADCDTNGHVFHNIDVTVNETCYSLGEDTVYCAVCGEGYETYDRAMLPHTFEKYDINRTADGLIYSACKNDGCVEKRYSTMTKEAYTGTINVYYDMQDDFAAALYNGGSEPNWFDNFKFENGVARTCEESYIQNYSRLNLDYYNNKPNTTDWSVAFDMTFNGKWDTDDVTNNGYDHETLWMLGGNNAMFLHFNTDTDLIYVTSNPYSGTSIPETEVGFDFVEGETYAVQFSFKQYEVVIDEWENEDGEIEQITEPAVDFYVYINGEAVLEYDYFNFESDIIGLAYTNGGSFAGFYNQSFGVDFSVDNFVIGSSDFKWAERCYEGDVNGDNYFDAADALAMRKLLAKVIDGSELAQTRMDMNGDGVINAKDQLAIRKALAA